MKILVACNEQSIALNICNGLQRLGLVNTSASACSLESLRTLSDTNDSAQLIVFVCGQRFAAAEFAALEQLSSGSCRSTKVVAVGPANDTNTVLNAIRNGAADYLDVNGNLETDLRSLVERLTASQQGRASIGRLITVLGTVGGGGASLLAVNLAAALAKPAAPCGLLDLKLQGGDLAVLLNSVSRHTLLSLAEKNQQFDRAMYDQAVIKHKSGVHLIASPEPFSDFRKINPQVIQKVVAFARSSCPIVIADLEDAEHLEQVQTLAESEKIILPIRLDFVAVYRAKKCIENLLRSRIRRDHIIPVANRVGRPKELSLERVAEVLEQPVEYSLPDDPDAANASFNLGVPVMLAAPKSKIALSIASLAAHVAGRPEHTTVETTRSSLLSIAPRAAAYVAGFLGQRLVSSGSN